MVGAAVAGWLGVVGLARAGDTPDVLVPEATPGQVQEYAMAFMFYDMLVNSLRAKGLNVADADVLREAASDSADVCFDNEACPNNLWGAVGAPMAVVLGVSRSAVGLSVEARVYRKGELRPVRVVREDVPLGAEQAYVDGLTVAVIEQLAMAKEPAGAGSVGAGSVSGTTASAAKASGSPSAQSTSSAGHSAGAKGRTDAVDKDLRRLFLPAGLRAKYAESGKPLNVWLDEQRFRAGKVNLEFTVGGAFGDVDRGYGVWAGLDAIGVNTEINETSTWLGDTTGAGGFGELAIGYTPMWFLDLSVGLGFQQGHKRLEAGWECPECTVVEGVEDTPAALSLQLLVEPRLRVLILPTGFVKPYVLADYQLRVFDGFLPPSTYVDYPTAAGGIGSGVGFGVGVSIDATPRFSAFLEVPYTLFLSPDPTSHDAASVVHQPAELPSTGGALRLAGGISLHL